MHLDDLVLRYVEGVGEVLGRRLDRDLKLPSLLVEVVKELPLVLCRAELHHPPVGKDVLENIGPDPPGSVRGELDTAVGIEAIHRLNQPHVPLLDQVKEVLITAPILIRELHDQSEIRRHQPPPGLTVSVLTHRFASSCSSSRERSG